MIEFNSNRILTNEEKNPKRSLNPEKWDIVFFLVLPHDSFNSLKAIVYQYSLKFNHGSTLFINSSLKCKFLKHKIDNMMLKLIWIFLSCSYFRFAFI